MFGYWKIRVKNWSVQITNEKKELPYYISTKKRYREEHATAISNSLLPAFIF